MFDRVIDTLRTKYDKVPMFWYETDFKEIQEGCVTFAWRNGLTEPAVQAAIHNNAKIMMCPGDYCYFDYPMAKGDMPEVNWGMPVRTFETVYQFDQVGAKVRNLKRTISLAWPALCGANLSTRPSAYSTKPTHVR